MLLRESNFCGEGGEDECLPPPPSLLPISLSFFPPPISIRRGHLVYTSVCASCHSLNRISYRNLVGVCYSEDEAKALAEDITVMDGPNDTGEMFERPGKLSDRLPSPYKNEEQARSINNGALPPDLSLIGKSRGRGEDYIFALLTGYKDAPAGIVVNTAGGQHYNPYFAGGKIGMAKQLVDGAVEYPDGTPATASQMAKDVAVFLAWAAEPDQDSRKEAGLKFILAMSLAACITGYYKRFRWGPLKNRKLSYTDDIKK
jgi:ubiquinol-cytochrome c reductase cytochrome c1 subunit